MPVALLLLAALAVLSVAGYWLAKVHAPLNILDRVVRAGELRLVTRQGPGTYYEGPFGPMGLDYDLARSFADSLGVGLQVMNAGTQDEVLAAVGNGRADLAAAHLGVTRQPAEPVRFTPPYLELPIKVVARMGQRGPGSLRDLIGTVLEVPAGSSYADVLHRLAPGSPQLTWTERPGAVPEHLMTLVWERLIDYTLADAQELAMAKRLYPELYGAFGLGVRHKVGWAFADGGDDSLYQAAVSFLRRAQREGEVVKLVSYYYDYLERIHYVDKTTFRRHMLQRLPRWRPAFERAARAHDLDWRLLAAIAYQESHWDPKAVSPTGVKGMMMLTLPTARQVGVGQRLDPEQSISGGARYFSWVKSLLPARTADPDRTWMALAGYNLGYGHLQDARTLTARQGANPDRWVEVKHRLRLLSRREHYTTLRYGYARGYEAHRFVERIRYYYDLLLDSLGTEVPAGGPSPALGILPLTL